MTELAQGREDPPPPRWVPAALAFVAGYVDVFTFLALFGLFVAQVTGSFVTAGAELVTHDTGIAGKAAAICAFLLATAVTAGLIGWMRDHGRDALPWMLAFETLLLAIFAGMLLAGPPASVEDWRGIVAGVFGAMAMGTQSVIVRLLMRGIPQTNVMTGNMTQLGVETTALIVAWRRRSRDPADRNNEREFFAVLARLAVVLAIAVGFVFGAAAGAIAYAKAGLVGAPLAVALVGALTVWAVLRNR
ncbi:MAG: DUF1275 domain-containing protein [Hyphomicrobiales bacterium]|nr:DUF1275 domain-containing protein [Hyphomicrobiales bacterium]